MTRPSNRFRPERLAVLALATLALIAGPVLADDDEPNIFTLGKSFHFDCDEGEDCLENLFMARSGGFLGVELTTLSPELRSHFGVSEDTGVLISRVVEDSPADNAGLQVGDIITAIDGQATGSSGAVGRAIRGLDEGGPVDIDVYRDGELLTVRADIEVRERTTFDLGSFMADRGVEISKTMEGIDWQELAESSRHISQDAVREALSGLENVFTEENFDVFIKRMDSFDEEGFEEKMELLRKRMEELEKRLEKRFEDNDTP